MSLSENKGADQLRGYRVVDLRLFSNMQNAGFLMTRLILFKTALRMANTYRLLFIFIMVIVFRNCDFK